jgi:hypothetical protein
MIIRVATSDIMPISRGLKRAFMIMMVCLNGQCFSNLNLFSKIVGKKVSRVVEFDYRTPITIYAHRDAINLFLSCRQGDEVLSPTFLIRTALTTLSCFYGETEGLKMNFAALFMLAKHVQNECECRGSIFRKTPSLQPREPDHCYD